MQKILIGFLIFFSFVFCISSVVASDSWLFITQVHLDSTDERLELTNFTQTTFSWTIDVLWVNSWVKSVYISIAPTESIVIWDSWVKYGDLPEWSELWLWFVIKDDPDVLPYSVSISLSWTLLTEIFLDESIIDKHNNVKTPIKIEKDWNIYIEDIDIESTIPDDTLEEKIWWTWTILWTKILTTTWSTVFSPTWNSWSWTVITWSVIDSSLTWSVENSVFKEVVYDTPVIHDIQEETPIQSISLIEAYPYDTDYLGEYLLVKYEDAVTEPFLLYGIGRWWTSWKLIDTCFGPAGSYVVFTDSPQLINENSWYIICALPSLSITDSWPLC